MARENRLWVQPDRLKHLLLQLRPVSKLDERFNLGYIDNELTIKWLNRLRATANNNASREQHAQLSSILDYYNKVSSGTQGMDKIDWDTYTSNIHTPNVVDKIKEKYDGLMAAEF